MKTTEVFIEQVLIGFIVLLVGAMLFWEKVHPILFKDAGAGKDDLIGKLLASAAFVGIAYLIGIIYDRCADTLLQYLEQSQRVNFALAKYQNNLTDPFPENELLIRILDAESAVTTYASYLRARMRLSRALTTLVPTLTCAALLIERKETELWHVGAIGMPVIYAAVLIFQILKPTKEYSLPKTYEMGNIINEAKSKPGETVSLCSGYSVQYLNEKLKLNYSLKFFWKNPVILGMVLLVILNLILVLYGNPSYQESHVLVFILGIVLTFLACWTWGRITRNIHEPSL